MVRLFWASESFEVFENDQNVMAKTKKLAKNILGRNGVKMIQKVMHKND